jgi:hypothetical protein
VDDQLAEKKESDQNVRKAGNNNQENENLLSKNERKG